MTTRGGGHPKQAMVLTHRFRERARRPGALAADAGPLLTYRIQGCGAMHPRPPSGLPSDRHPDNAPSMSPCSKPSRCGLARMKQTEGPPRRPSLTASGGLCEARIETKKPLEIKGRSRRTTKERYAAPTKPFDGPHTRPARRSLALQPAHSRCHQFVTCIPASAISSPP